MKLDVTYVAKYLPVTMQLSVYCSATPCLLQVDTSFIMFFFLFFFYQQKNLNLLDVM